MTKKSTRKKYPVFFARLSKDAKKFIVNHMKKNGIPNYRFFMLSCLKSLGYEITDNDVNMT